MILVDYIFILGWATPVSRGIAVPFALYEEYWSKLVGSNPAKGNVGKYFWRDLLIEMSVNLFIMFSRSLLTTHITLRYNQYLMQTNDPDYDYDFKVFFLFVSGPSPMRVCGFKCCAAFRSLRVLWFLDKFWRAHV